MIDNLISDKDTNYVSYDLIEYCTLNDGTSKDENPKVTVYAYFLEACQQIPPSLTKGRSLWEVISPYLMRSVH